MAGPVASWLCDNCGRVMYFLHKKEAINTKDNLLVISEVCACPACRFSAAHPVKHQPLTVTVNGRKK